MASGLRWLPFSSRVLGPPRGVVNVREVPGVDFREVHPPHAAHRVPFPTATDSAATPEEWTEPATFVASIPGARVWSSRGIVLTAHDQVVRESSRATPAESSPVFGKIWLCPVKKLRGTVAVVAGRNPNSFYHWMLETLPRLELLRLAGVDADHYFVGQDTFAFQRRTLDMLGVPADRTIGNTSRKTHIQADCIALAAPTGSRQMEHTPMWVVEWLRRKFLTQAPAKEATGRLYVAKRSRGVTNEAELVSLLESRGFRTLYLEDLPIEEQTACFANAEVVVAAHGAGLTHIVFSRAGTTVIELFSPDRIGPCFWNLCHQLNLVHVSVVGEIPPGPPGDGAFSVKPTDLAAALDAAGIR